MQATHEQEAHEQGIAAAKAAASWAVDGNTSAEHIARMVAMFDEGDPALYDYLPAEPNLSGEWADAPTPLSLARDITGEDDPSDETIGALADAFEAGVMETFHFECERIIRAAA